MKKYIPLLLVESYLALTLFILAFGVVRFNIHNGIFFGLYCFCITSHFVLDMLSLLMLSMKL